MVVHPAGLIRVGIAATWLLAPPVLSVVALRRWRRTERADGKTGWLLITASAVLGNWGIFVGLALVGQIGGFGSHFMTTRLADVFFLVSLLVLIASFFVQIARWQLSLASVLILALWVGQRNGGVVA